MTRIAPTALKSTAFALFALAATTFALAPSTAEAGPKKKSHVGVHISLGGGPLYFGYGYYGYRPIYVGYHRSCRWLRIRALNTGSAYWWHRYNRCRFGEVW